MQAKLIRATAKVAVYEVRGTSAEIKAYEASITAQGRTVSYKTAGKDGPQVKNDRDEPIPLYFTPFPLPGREKWHEMVLIQSGPNKGTFTLDTDDLNFDKLMAKSLGQDLGEHISAQLATKHTGVSLNSKAPKASSIILTDDDEDLTAETDDQAEPASASADMDALTEQPVAEATEKPKTSKP